MTPRKRAAKRKPAKKTVKRPTKKSSKRGVKRPSNKKSVRKKISKTAKRPKRAKRKTPKTRRKATKKSAKPAKKKALKKTVKRPTKKSAEKVHKKGQTTTQNTAVKRRLQRQLEQRVIRQQTRTRNRSRRRVKRHTVLPLGESQRIDTTVTALKELQRRGKICDWKITMVHVRKANLYMGKSFSEETTLRAQRKDIVATVYTKNQDGTMGEAKVPIMETSIKDIRQLLNDAIEVCAHAKQQRFNIPAPQGEIEMPECHDENVLDVFMGEDWTSVAQCIGDKTKKALSQARDIMVNCLEVLTSGSTTRIINSSGLDISYHKTLIYYELTLSSEGTNGKQEFTYRAKAVSPEQLNLSVALPEQAAIAKDVANAETCEEFDGDVLLAGRSLVDFFTPDDNINPVLLHTFARMKILGVNRFELDKQLGDFQGEPFTISTNPCLPRAVHTMPVDEDGTPLKHTELIRNGVMVKHIAPARDAQYLGVPATGMLTNVHVGEGATREEHLRGQNYVEIASFSWFLPDPYSGDFSAEIRLGYRWFRGKKTPFKGGHLTGNVFEHLLNARFSREIIQSGSYYGPRAVMFKEGKIAGKR